MASPSGEPFIFPKLLARQRVAYGLRFLSRIDGSLVEIFPNIVSIKAALGVLDVRPSSGRFKLQIGDPADEIVTGFIESNAEASRVREALNAIPGLGVEFLVESAPGSWLIRRADGEAFPLAVVANQLKPTSFGRIEGYQVDGDWVYELRLTQAPLAFADMAERVLPPAPSVVTVRDGGSDGPHIWNEIQKLIIPPDFRGVYEIRRLSTYARSRLLDTSDGPDEVKSAVDALFAPDRGSVVVTNPTDNEFHLEFGGALEGTDVEELAVVVHSAPPGDWTFTLDLGSTALLAALRERSEISVQLEVEILVAPSDENPVLQGGPYKLISAPITLGRALVSPDLAMAHDIPWLRPPSPKTYVPFSLSQIITGNQHYVSVIEAGVTTEYPIPHYLGTSALHLAVRENRSAGLLLHPSEYTVRFDSDSEITLIFPDPPVADLAVLITSAGPKSAFVEDLEINIPQVRGLEDIIFAMGQRIVALESILPSVIPAVRDTESPAKEIEIPDRVEIYPGRFADNVNFTALLTDGADLPKPPGLLPALHNITVSPLTTPLPPAKEHEGEVFQNLTGAPVLIPGGLGRRGKYLAANGYAGSDGRVWYPLTRDGTTNSFFPTDFEHEFFVLPVNDRMLRAGQTLTLEYTALLGMLKATTKAQALLVLEVGSVPSQPEPAPTGVNLLDVVWNIESPLLCQRIILSDLPIKHTFGAAIRRDNLGALKADARYYDHWEAATTAPESANFALRARIIQFDTENSVPNERGFIYYQLSEGKASIS